MARPKPVAAVPRTLADQLRSWSEAELTALLAARPDLAVPAPQDSSQLASRAGVRASVTRALDQLTMLELAVLDAAVALGGTTSERHLVSTVRAESANVATAIERLRTMALLWGTTEELRVVGLVADVLDTAISGLGPTVAQLLSGYGPNRVAALATDLGLTPSGDRDRDVAAIAQALGDPATVNDLVARTDPQARAILDHLERTGADGSFEGPVRELTVATAVTPAGQLVARGLLLPRDNGHVTVPREVARSLRGGRTTREAMDQQPPLATSPTARRLVDQASAGASYELVRHMELLLEHWGVEPPVSLRGGGLAVRDLKAAARLLRLEERVTALHIEVAAAAGLLAVGITESSDSAWLPTDAFDAWFAADTADRWAVLAEAWLTNPRLTGLLGSRLNGRVVNALSPELERAWLPETRFDVLTELGGIPDGQVLAGGTGVPSLVARLQWRRPRRPTGRAEAVAWVVEEAAVLGVVGLGGLSAPGRAMLLDADRRHAASAALGPLLPQPVDHILVQADLTAVAPGPLAQDLARDLAAVADIESRGGATVYRFTESSVRRAFDAGWSAAEVHEFIASSSRTEVPQPLRYLVDDVSRTFGTLRLGAAESFLRSDDETALTALVHEPKAASLRLRRIAPTVLVSDMPLDVLLPRLRDLGLAPVVEAPDGTVRVARSEAHRARTPKRRPPLDRVEAHDPRALARSAAHIAATVTAIRAGDRAAENRPADAAQHGLRRTGSTSTLATLREAVDASASVWIGYVGSDGSTHERIVDPIKVEAGWLQAFDHRSEEIRRFALHRISGVHEVTSG